MRELKMVVQRNAAIVANFKLNAQTTVFALNVKIHKIHPVLLYNIFLNLQLNICYIIVSSTNQSNRIMGILL